MNIRYKRNHSHLQERLKEYLQIIIIIIVKITDQKIVGVMNQVATSFFLYLMIFFLNFGNSFGKKLFLNVHLNRFVLLSQHYLKAKVSITKHNEIKDELFSSF